MMANFKCGRGTARSTLWGSPLPLIKTQSGGPGLRAGRGNSINDGCSQPEGLQGARLQVRFGSLNVGSMSGRLNEVVEMLARRRVAVCWRRGGKERVQEW